MGDSSYWAGEWGWKDRVDRSRPAAAREKVWEEWGQWAGWWGPKSEAWSTEGGRAAKVCLSLVYMCTHTYACMCVCVCVLPAYIPNPDTPNLLAHLSTPSIWRPHTCTHTHTNTKTLNTTKIADLHPAPRHSVCMYVYYVYLYMYIYA